MALKNSKPRSLLLVIRRPNSFLVRSTTPVDAAGALPYLIARRLQDLQDGKKLRASAGLPDPAAEIGKELVDDLTAHLGVTASTVTMPVGEDSAEGSDDPPAEPGFDGQTDLILVIRTKSWSLLPESALEGNRAPLYYTSRVQFELVDARGDRRTLAAGDCETGNDGHKTRTGYDEMVDANAIRLQELIERSIEICAHQFKGILFGVAEQPKT